MNILYNNHFLLSWQGRCSQTDEVKKHHVVSVYFAVQKLSLMKALLCREALNRKNVK